MRAVGRSAKIRVGILAAIFVVASVGVLFASRVFVAHGTAAKDPRVVSNVRFKAASAPARAYHPEHSDHVKPLLRPAIVTVNSPEKIGLGERGEIILTIEADRKGDSKAPFPRIGQKLTPVDVTKADGGVTRVYHAQVGDKVTTHLYELSSDVPLTSREEKTLPVPPEGAAAWTWHVTGSEPGSRPLEFELLADYVYDATPGHWPLGMMKIELPVDPTGWQWVKYYFAQIGDLWQYLVGIAGGLVAVAGALPIVRKLVPAGGKEAPRAQASA
jgi:hypothetical protein